MPITICELLGTDLPLTIRVENRRHTVLPLPYIVEAGNLLKIFTADGRPFVEVDCKSNPEEIRFTAATYVFPRPYMTHTEDKHIKGKDLRYRFTSS